MKLKVLVVLLALVATVPLVRADSSVYVGYSDGLRGPGFFPNPWSGDANTQYFFGTGTPYDAGAIMITNNGATNITINSLSMTLPGGSGTPTFNNGSMGWGTNLVLNPGMNAIFTQTAFYNFDTSDYESYGAYACLTRNAFCDSIAPQVTVTIDSVSTTFNDYGHVLDTYGFDLASQGNESIGWHQIGTDASNRNNNVVPEPASMVLFVSGALGLFSKRKFRK